MAVFYRCDRCNAETDGDGLVEKEWRDLDAGALNDDGELEGTVEQFGLFCPDCVADIKAVIIAAPARTA